MTPRYVKAVFKGHDGEFGFRRNMEYHIAVTPLGGDKIQVTRLSDNQEIDHRNILDFLTKWDSIRDEPYEG